jgi:hypothetical protein
MFDDYFPYIVAAALFIMALALWYGWRACNRVPRDPTVSENDEIYADGFDAGYQDGHSDGYFDEPRRPDYAVGDDDKPTRYALGYREGYAEGYEAGQAEGDRDEEAGGLDERV